MVTFMGSGGGGMPSAGESSSSYLDNASQETGVALGGGGSAPSGPSSAGFPFAYRGSVSKTMYMPGLFPVSARDEFPSHVVHRDQRGNIIKMANQFANSGDKNIRQMALLLAMGGFVGTVDKPSDAVEYAKSAPLGDVLDAYAKFLQQAANGYAMALIPGSGAKKQTPMAMLRRAIEYRWGSVLKDWDGNLNSLDAKQLSKMDAAVGEEKFTGTKKFTATSVNTMSPEDARSMVRTMLQNNLGRDPTQAEYEDFVASLHKAERSHPTTTTTTTEYKAGEPVSSSSSSSGGISSEGLNQLMYERLKEQPTWKEWQAVGVYAPTLMASLGTPVEGV